MIWGEHCVLAPKSFMKEHMQKEIRWLLQEKYKGQRTAEAEKDIARLEKGEHADYVIGWVNFAGCKIDLSQRPLIPRPETEYWVEKAIEEIKIVNNQQLIIKVLDIFAGSGCVGVAVLQYVPNAAVDFAEKDKKLLKQIKINADINDIDKKRYHILQSDIFSNVKGRYDYILANPPYVAEARKSRVQKSVLEQEPHNAVFGGADGLQYIQEFLSQAKKHLNPGGVVYLEFDSQQKARVIKLSKRASATIARAHKDQYNKWRYARIVF